MVSSTHEPGSPDLRSGKLARSARMVDCQRAQLQFANIMSKYVRFVFTGQDSDSLIDTLLASALQRNMSFTEDRKRQHTPSTANRWGGLIQATRFCSDVMPIWKTVPTDVSAGHPSYLISEFAGHGN